MKIIGFNGGSSLIELGPAADVQLFFDCMMAFVVKKHPDEEWTVLADRLYRRYLRPDELAPAQTLMDEVQKVFRHTPSADINWDDIAPSKTRLDPDQPTLADVFADYFSKFSSAKKSAEIFHERFKVYQPVKLVVADMPAFLEDKKRPLEQYDSLEGQPFWKR